MKNVKIYTDGACRGNPGRGGYGVVLKSGSFEKELSAGFIKTTNNRMELLAAIVGLEALKEPCRVEVYSDSKYVVDAHNLNWIAGWKRKGWRRGKNEKLANVDLWKRLDQAEAPHEMSWNWVKGHAGHDQNERCDELATGAADGDELEEDLGFEG